MRFATFVVSLAIFAATTGAILETMDKLKQWVMTMLVFTGTAIVISSFIMFAIIIYTINLDIKPLNEYEMTQNLLSSHFVNVN